MVVNDEDSAKERIEIGRPTDVRHISHSPSPVSAASSASPPTSNQTCRGARPVPGQWRPLCCKTCSVQIATRSKPNFFEKNAGYNHCLCGWFFREADVSINVVYGHWWNIGGSCDNTNPLAKGSGIHLNHSEDGDAEGAVRGTRIKLVDVTALSRQRDQGGIYHGNSIKATLDVQDCLHWCLPGVPDTWNENLAAQL